jgi:hypothetical protein
MLISRSQAEATLCDLGHVNGLALAWKSRKRHYGRNWLCSFPDGHLVTDSPSQQANRIKNLKGMEARRTVMSCEASAHDFRLANKVNNAEQFVSRLQCTTVQLTLDHRLLQCTWAGKNEEYRSYKKHQWTLVAPDKWDSEALKPGIEPNPKKVIDILD